MLLNLHVGLFPYQRRGLQQVLGASQAARWGACFAGDIPRIDEYLQNGQDVNEVNPVLWNYNAIDCA